MVINIVLSCTFFHRVFTDVRFGLVHIFFFLVCTELFLDVIFEFPHITLSSEINNLPRWLLSIGMVLFFITYTQMHTNTLFFLNRYLCMFTHTVARAARKKINGKQTNMYIFTWKTGGFSDGSKCVGAIILNMVHGRKNQKSPAKKNK